VFSQMILKGGSMIIPGTLLILLAIGAAAMGLFQTYSKSLKEKLEKPSLPGRPEADEARRLDSYREPVPTITERTTELLAQPKGVETGKIVD